MMGGSRNPSDPCTPICDPTLEAGVDGYWRTVKPATADGPGIRTWESLDGWPWHTLLDSDDSDFTPIAATPAGRTLLVDGTVTLLHGPGGTGKSTTALLLCAQVADAGGRALYLSWERHLQQRQVSRLLRAAGMDRLADPANGFALVDMLQSDGQGDDALRDDRRAEKWVRRAPRGKPSLVVIDCVTTAGGAYNDALGYAAWIKEMCQRWMGDTGANPLLPSMLLIDHQSKSGKGEARGSAVKREQCDIELEAAGAAWTQHDPGEVKLIVRRDNLGVMHARKGEAAAVVKGRPTATGLDLELCDSTGATRDVLSEVFEALGEGPASRKGLQRAVGARYASIADAVSTLIADGVAEELDDGRVGLVG